MMNSNKWNCCDCGLYSTVEKVQIASGGERYWSTPEYYEYSSTTIILVVHCSTSVQKYSTLLANVHTYIVLELVLVDIGVL